MQAAIEERLPEIVLETYSDFMISVKEAR